MSGTCERSHLKALKYDYLFYPVKWLKESLDGLVYRF